MWESIGIGEDSAISAFYSNILWKFWKTRKYWKTVVNYTVRHSRIPNACQVANFTLEVLLNSTSLEVKISTCRIFSPSSNVSQIKTFKEIFSILRLTDKACLFFVRRYLKLSVLELLLFRSIVLSFYFEFIYSKEVVKNST